MTTVVLRPEKEGGVGVFAGLLSTELGASIESLPAAQVGIARKIKGATCVIFNYVGYGYARRGAPWGLVRELVAWRGAVMARRLVTVFHEVYAYGPPWRSSFWLSPVQRRLARQLSRASDACVTSNELFAAILRRWVPAEKISTLPVFSNIGEPVTLPSWNERAARLVVFGTPGLRQRAYGRMRGELASAIESLGIEEVLDLGAPVEVPSAVGGVTVRRGGYIGASDASAWLASSRFGFVIYPPRLLGKSGVFAAYSAHGLCPIVGWPKGRGGSEPSATWLRAGVPTGAQVAEEVAAAAAAEYRSHSLARHADLYRRLLSPCAS